MADDKTTRGNRLNVVAIDKAQRRIARIRAARLADPEPMTPRGDGRVLAGKANAGMDGLPMDKGCECPVEPIGFDGSTMYVIDSMRQFRAIKSNDFNQAGIQALFAAAPNYPKWWKPRWGAQMVEDPDTGQKKSMPVIKSFQRDDIAEAILYACAQRGFFSPAEKMRGRGAWTLSSGSIVHHAGDALWTCEGGKFRELPTGLHEGKLYPRLSSILEPWREKISIEDNPAAKLLELFRKWNWTRPDVDPVLLLGWICCALIGGALDWRSSVLLLGDWGTGKSKLQEFTQAVFGEALMSSSDTTAAGIYQQMAHDSRPVALDELEPDADSRKLNAVTHLMRTSSSGAIGQRGGSTRSEASQFQMRSAFLFSAINNPLHSAQDMSRCAVLRLMPLNQNQAPPPPIDANTGEMMLALMMQGWGDGGLNFKHTLARMMLALEEGGHTPRGQKQYGTLLACAYLALGPELSRKLKTNLAEGDDLEWAEMLAATELPEVEDAKQNYRQCTDRILTSLVKSWRNSARNTIGQAIEDFQKFDGIMERDDHDLYDFAKARRDINMAGFGLFRANEIVAGACRTHNWTPDKALAFYEFDPTRPSSLVLAVPNNSSKVAAHLEGTDYAQGAWKDALRQCPAKGVMIAHKDINRQTIDGTRQSCTLIVLDRYHEAGER